MGSQSLWSKMRLFSQILFIAAHSSTQKNGAVVTKLITQTRGLCDDIYDDRNHV